MSFRREGGTIWSDEGWSISALGRTQIKYVEGDQAAILSCEFPYGEDGEHGIALYPGQIKIWQAPEGKTITSEERTIVIGRAKAALEWSGLQVHFSTGGTEIWVLGNAP